MTEDSTDFAEFSKKAKTCDIVRFTFCDINGLPRTCLIPGSQAQEWVHHGVTWWAGLAAVGIHGKPKTSPKEVAAINDGNASAVPVLRTFYEPKWCCDENLRVGEVREAVAVSNSNHAGRFGGRARDGGGGAGRL